jgi:hypothetical protein
MPPFWVLEVNVTPDDVFVTRYDVPPELEQSYLDARPIAQGEPVRLYYEGASSRRTDFVAGVQPFQVGSARLREVFTEAAVEGVEYHHATLVCEDDGSEDDSWWLLNVLTKVEALDWDRATVDVYTGTEKIVGWIHKLAIREDVLDGLDLVRLAEMAPIVLVSDRLRTTIEDAALTGIGFRAIEDFGER